MGQIKPEIIKDSRASSQKRSWQTFRDLEEVAQAQRADEIKAIAPNGKPPKQVKASFCHLPQARLWMDPRLGGGNSIAGTFLIIKRVYSISSPSGRSRRPNGC